MRIEVMMESLLNIVRLSNKYGANPDYVLAGGGNTSVKIENALYVKCSGTQLKTIDTEGFVPVSRAALSKTMDKLYPQEDALREAEFLSDVMAARTLPNETRRPSVEALLHNLFPQKYVLHLHPALVNGLTCSVQGKKAAEKLFGDEIIWIPVCKPGYLLAKRCAEKLKEHMQRFGRQAQIALLENHGIFVAGDTLDEVDSLFSSVMKRLEAVVSAPGLTPVDMDEPAIGTRLKTRLGMEYVRYGAFTGLLDFIKSKEAAKPLLSPFTPDHIVYCGAYPMYLEDLEDLEALSPITGKIVIVQDKGFYAFGDTQKAADTAAELFTDAVKIACYAGFFGGPLHMTKEMIDFIVNWEAESYRKSQA